LQWRQRRLSAEGRGERGVYVDILFPINAGTFRYSVPEGMIESIRMGCRVIAPFRRRERVGIIFNIIEDDSQDTIRIDDREVRIREIKGVIDDEPIVPSNILRLITWVSNYYISSPGIVLKYAVPSGFFSGMKSGKTRITYEASHRGDMVERLTPHQEGALRIINSRAKGVFLLHGVTGSGKTEVYIRAIKSLPEEKVAIVLVPEIAITSQIIDRFMGQFNKGVVFYHSGLSSGERMRIWEMILKEEVKVVIGVRSAVFAPVRDLGMIIVDEEHEASYKQFEGLRYSARDVALVRAEMEGARIILGSATPSMETFHAAKSGRFIYICLPERVDNRPMPEVEIIDMTRESKKTFSLSERLLEVVRQNTARGRQSILLINRRGYAPFMICSDCGYTYKCPSCSITMIFHRDTNKLHCHYCNGRLNPATRCPQCKGTKVKYLGTGTQRVEEELHRLIPELSLIRMDRDTTRKKFSHYRILRQMEDGKTDILLGTQMVAKGHDLPDVTLSAIVYGDVILNLPDFRSAERAFQLFTQLAGRSGRGELAGRAFIQTYEPEHYVFEFVRKHDYEGFYKRERELRRELGYPPYGKMIRIVLRFKDRSIIEPTIKFIRRNIKRVSSREIDILGPSPAPVEKIRNRWRWHMIIKGREMKRMRYIAQRILTLLQGRKDPDVEIDVDPVSML